MLYLVDDRGQIRRPTQQLQTTFGTRLPPAQFAEFLVRNYKWISLRVDGSACELRLRPSRVGEETLSVASEELRGTTVGQYRLAWYGRGWSGEDFDTASEAASRLMSLVSSAHTRDRIADFLRRPRKREHLLQHDPLNLLLDAWSSGIRGAEDLAIVADDLLGGRYILAGRDGPSQDMCILAGGQDFNIIGRDWLSRVPRLRIADWPDVAYGGWVEQSYQVAWHSDVPMLDDLDCIIQWPTLGRRRHGYRRLILPGRSASGSRLLLGAMRIDPHVDLRAQVH
jgi:hypothetical protein